MSAITDAARTGVSTRDATMYCTTFPCHICAKHIVAAGLRTVKYIEPYPKSYAEQLQNDSIAIGTKMNVDGKCQFTPFIGIAPYQFDQLFERGKRKNRSGGVEAWIDGSPKPNIKYTLPLFVMNETAVIRILKMNAKRLQNEGKIDVAGELAPDLE